MNQKPQEKTITSIEIGNTYNTVVMFDGEKVIKEFWCTYKQTKKLLKENGPAIVQIRCNWDLKQFTNRIEKLAKATGYINKMERVKKWTSASLPNPFEYTVIIGSFVKEGLE